MLKQIHVAIIVACSLAILFQSACAGNTPTPVTPANTSVQEGDAPSPSPSPTAPAIPTGAPSTTGSNAQAIDTSKYDAEIKRLEKQAEMRPGDDASRLALAKAYLARGNALTQAHQYRAALGDYRRALRYDPDNEEARQWAATITGILQQMGREVPTEGNEPPPMPMTPDTIAGDEDASTEKEPKSSKQKTQGKKP